MTAKFIGYQCSICNTEYAPDEVTYTCPQDGGNLDVLLDYETLKKSGMDNLIGEGEPSLWRYLPLLPVADPGVIANCNTPAALREALSMVRALNSEL